MSTTATLNTGNFKTRTAGSATYTQDLVNGQNGLQISGNAGSFVLTHLGNNVTVNAGVDAATLQSQLESLTSIGTGHVTVTGSDGAFTIVFDNTITDTQLTTSAALLFNDVAGSGAWTVEPESTLTVVADAGLFTLSHNGQSTSRLAFNANAEAIQYALEQLAGIGNGGVTLVATATPGVFTVTFANGVTPRLSTNADPGQNDGAGLLRITSASDVISLTSIEGIEDSSKNDLLIGDSAANTFSFSDNSGNNLVYGGGGADVLDFSKVTTTV
ncbi:MAG: hypothetical protein ACK50J_26945, partial [Planctomyces sp.]